jgi:hypothetical protein
MTEQTEAVRKRLANQERFARQIVNAVLMAPTAVQADEIVMALLTEREADAVGLLEKQCAAQLLQIARLQATIHEYRHGVPEHVTISPSASEIPETHPLEPKPATWTRTFKA